MTRPGAVTVLLAALVLAGCSGGTAQPVASTASGPTTPPVSLVEALGTTAPVASPPPGAEARFLAILAARGVPYTGRNPAGEASVVCATFAADQSVARDEVVALQSFPDPADREAWVDAAVEVYCPQFG